MKNRISVSFGENCVKEHYLYSVPEFERCDIVSIFEDCGRIIIQVADGSLERILRVSLGKESALALRKILDQEIATLG
jgi:hypothetical protein